MGVERVWGRPASGTWAQPKPARSPPIRAGRGGSAGVDLAGRRGATVLPSTRAPAIFKPPRPDRRGFGVILTSSGGPFRGKTPRLADVTPEEAAPSPDMADGAEDFDRLTTLMNKAAECEARWLFGLERTRSRCRSSRGVVHSMVEFVDGSVVAQLSPPDMRLPIQFALTYPDRVPGPSPRLDFSSSVAYTFEPPDRETFPCLELGFEVMRRGGTAGAALNAANEAAVSRFLEGEITFLDIPRACRAALDHHHFDPHPSLDELWKVDAWARQEVGRWNS